jgi:hypothetical protein
MSASEALLADATGAGVPNVSMTAEKTIHYPLRALWWSVHALAFDHYKEQFKGGN